jgi:membrane protein
MTRKHDTAARLGSAGENVEGGTSVAPMSPEDAMPVSATEPGESASGARGGAAREQLRFLVELVSETFDRFSDNDGYRLGAAFSYYATFSIFPLVLLSVTVVGFILGDSASARQQMLSAIATEGSPAREVIERALMTMQAHSSARGLSAFVAVGTLLFGASGAFVELDAALNRIWCVPKRRSSGVLGSIRLFLLERLSGFAIVVGLGFTLFVSLVSSAVLSFLVARAEAQVALPVWPTVARTADVLLSVALLAGLFTAAFHLIPRTRPAIRAVAPGAMLTTVLFLILKELFAAYLSRLMSYSAYGVAGGVLALAAWIYLSSMIVFLGAQLTRVHAERKGAVEVCKREYRTGRPKDPAP